MSSIQISGNALDFKGFMTCIEASTGSPAQNYVKAEVHDRILKVWPEFDHRKNLARIDDQSEEALKLRTMELDTMEQGALAETFLAAVKPETTKTAAFMLFRGAAQLIQVSGWWTKQVKGKLEPFAAGDKPQFYADPQPAGEASKTTP
jgi:hypothetical protein